MEVAGFPLEEEKKPELEDGGSCSGISTCDLEVLTAVVGACPIRSFLVELSMNSICMSSGS